MKTKNYLKLMLIIMLAVLLAACSAKIQPTSDNIKIANISEQTGNVARLEYSLDDIAKHNQVSDCWMAINGAVYDVTSFVSKHPGGPAIIKGCGKDATTIFESIKGGAGHPQRAVDNLDNFLIGNLK